MPIAPTYPGVYVQEVPSGVRTIVGVSTSTALFVGVSADGPMDTPTVCLNYSQFAKEFGDDSSKSDLARYVRLFFLNGGTKCYVMRIADSSVKSKITLRTEANTLAMTLTAKNDGVRGDNIRAAVTYDTEQPEATFNVELFRWDTDATGRQTKAGTELWRNLSMNEFSASYAPKVLTQNSALVSASRTSAPTAAPGSSQAGRPFDLVTGFQAAWDSVVTAASNTFQISVGGSSYVPVSLPVDGTIVDEASLKTGIETAVRAAVAALPGNLGANISAQTVVAPPAVVGVNDDSKWFRIEHATLDVFIRPSLTNDVAVPLMLGTAQGGLEVGAFAGSRPAPTGTSITPTGLIGGGAAFAALDPAAVVSMDLDGETVAFNTGTPAGLQTSVGGAMYRDSSTSSTNGNNDGIREKLELIRTFVADAAAIDPEKFPWRVDIWGNRLNFVRRDGRDDTVGVAPTFLTWVPDAGVRVDNVRFYSLGTSGSGPFQVAGVAGDDGNPPKASDYSDAYPIIDREVDLFNIVVLPSADGVDQMQLWGSASVFCQQRRAILLMDAPTAWTDFSKATAGVDDLRIGLVKDHAALYYPRLTISENGLPVHVGATGAIAGLMARTDSTRGVWKAPAGTEADIRGIVGLKQRFSDSENGELNPKAINTLRVFPTGVVCWGARTMDGDDSSPSDYKYVPIRRLALFIEESLYRGLKWVVFEPNDEPLWGQIRLNVGAFMHGLFTQGAFAGAKSSDAYFVRCDAETTTQDDRNKGIVNIWVGFAPLKPAEFVMLHLQQMAGEINV